MVIPIKAEASHLTSEEYWMMLEAVTTGTFVWNPESDLVRWSPRLLATLGYEDGDGAALRDIERLLHPDDLAPHRDAVRDSRRPGGRYRIEVRLRDKADAWRHFVVQGFWTERPDGGLRLCGFLQEIAEVASLREQAARREALFRDFFDRAPAAVFIKDKNCRHLYGNAFAAKLCGCSLEDFLAKPTHELFDEASGAALLAADRPVLERGETVTWSGEVRNASGETFYLVDTKFPIRDPATGETMVGGFGLDITEQRRVERLLAEARKREALGKLVAGIAHDFNNTLAVLQGNVELLDVVTDPADADECKRELRDAVERARRLTQQLLAYGRKAVLHSETISLNRIVGDMDKLLRRTLPETIRIETVLGGGLWNAELDRSQIESAILNLAINARDAMPAGGRLTIETANTRIGEDYVATRGEDVAPGRYVMLAISDTGTGMTEEVRSRAFDPFFTTKEVGHGTGMGLAMVWGLVKQLGGAARLYSEVAVGTTVTLLLPATAEAAAAEPQAAAEGLVGGSERILLVEDEESVRRVLARQLAQLGYAVTEAANGAIGLETLLGDPGLHLLVTDIVMPGPVQGPHLARRAREARPDLPVLFMSGYPMEAAIHGNGLRPDDVTLMKPVSLTELARAVRRVLDRRAPGGGA